MLFSLIAPITIDSTSLHMFYGSVLGCLLMALAAAVVLRFKFWGGIFFTAASLYFLLQGLTGIISSINVSVNYFILFNNLAFLVGGLFFLAGSMNILYRSISSRSNGS